MNITNGTKTDQDRGVIPLVILGRDILELDECNICYSAVKK